jgi:large subunit ribosomal protein L34
MSVFRQERLRAPLFNTRLFRSSTASQASSQLTTPGYKSASLLQIIKSKFSYTSAMPISQLVGSSVVEPSHPVLGQLVTHQLCRSREINNHLQRNWAWGRIFARSKVRCYFPRPCELKRIKRHGLKARLSTAAGRRIIMRRILKGRHVLSH